MSAARKDKNLHVGLLSFIPIEEMIDALILCPSHEQVSQQYAAALQAYQLQLQNCNPYLTTTVQGIGPQQYAALQMYEFPYIPPNKAELLTMLTLISCAIKFKKIEAEEAVK